jgi:Fe-S-cluster containining protein
MIEFLAYRTQSVRTSTGFLLEPAGPTHDLILRTARTDGGPEPCIFLGEDRGGGRCRIYPFRPDACRRFPARQTLEGIRAREHLVCPEGAWDGHPMNRLSWRVALAREQRHADLYSDVVSEWNERIEADATGSATIEGYLAYLSEVYAHVSSVQRPSSTARGDDWPDSERSAGLP